MSIVNDKPTPETDAAQHEGLLRTNSIPMQVVTANFARKLERERDEAREDLESEKNTRNAIIEKGLKLERQLREVQEALEYIANAGLSARHIEDYAKEFLSKK
jgi:hypothetical protein